MIHLVPTVLPPTVVRWLENLRRQNTGVEFVIPAQAGIQVADRVRHTVESRYPGVLERGLAWIPAFTGMTECYNYSCACVG